MSTKFIDRTGQVFGILVAVEPTHKMLSSGRKMPSWVLKCECGNTVVAMTTNLAKGHHMSCGCKRGENISAGLGYPGDTKKPEYHIYRQMLDRCYLKTAPNYKFYGAKGVTVCDRWRFGEGSKTAFQCFEEDMGRRPDKELTLDRSNPLLGYSKDNCSWKTWQHQANNKREHHSEEERLLAFAKKSASTRRGSRSHFAKLTEEQVKEIKRDFLDGMRLFAAARKHGITIQTANGIHKGHTWKHVLVGGER